MVALPSGISQLPAAVPWRSRSLFRTLLSDARADNSLAPPASACSRVCRPALLTMQISYTCTITCVRVRIPQSRLRVSPFSSSKGEATLPQPSYRQDVTSVPWSPVNRPTSAAQASEQRSSMMRARSEAVLSNDRMPPRPSFLLSESSRRASPTYVEFVGAFSA